MTQLTRDVFVAELQSRGHGRFTTASLNRYLDWALQDVYRMGKFEAVKDTQANGVLVLGDATVSFTVIATAAVNLHAINAVYIKDASGNLSPLEPARREAFWGDIFPNFLAPDATRLKGQPTQYYVYGEDLYLWPICDGAYTWYVHYTGRADSFASGAATSGLPERMDSAVLAAAEIQCCRRARDLTALALAEATLNDLINHELANEHRQFNEEYARIGRYEH